MQLSAVCAADTVSARPRRQTEEGCSLRLTPLTPGQQSATKKTGAKEQHTPGYAHYIDWQIWPKY